MPLVKSSSNKARSENIRREIQAGKNPKQAIAIAYSVQKKSKHPTSHKGETTMKAAHNKKEAGKKEHHAKDGHHMEHKMHMKEHHKHMKAHMKHLDGYMKKCK